MTTVLFFAVSADGVLVWICEGLLVSNTCGPLLLVASGIQVFIKMPILAQWLTLVAKTVCAGEIVASDDGLYLEE